MVFFNRLDCAGRKRFADCPLHGVIVAVPLQLQRLLETEPIVLLQLSPALAILYNGWCFVGFSYR